MNIKMLIGHSSKCNTKKLTSHRSMIRLKILHLAFYSTTILNAVLILTYVYWYLTIRTFLGSRFFLSTPTCCILRFILPFVD